MYKKTHGKLFFIVRFFFVVRRIKTHGKEALCRASERKCTTKIFTHDKLEFSRSEHYTSELCSNVSYGNDSGGHRKNHYYSMLLESRTLLTLRDSSGLQKTVT
jgi:hypothetical protein